MTTYRIGTRSSALALTQVELFRSAVAACAPEVAFETVPIITTGDKYTKGPLADIGGKGLFTKEIEEALLSGAIDLAVHSLKDVTAEMPPGLIIAGVLERADPRDCFISYTSASLDELPKASIVGTSSPRRHAQLMAMRPDLRIVPLRGNVPTRLKKLQDGEMDAAILAMAGLNRLKITDVPATPMSVESMLPAVAQGIIGIECRERNDDVRLLLERITHTPTMIAAAAEREMLLALGGSCYTPIAGMATLQGDQLTLEGLVASPDGSRHVRRSHTGAITDAVTIGRLLGEELKSLAGPDLLCA